MSEEGIPPEVRAFLTRQVHDLEQLEVLLLLSRQPDRRWTVRDLSQELRTSELSAGRAVEHLCKSGLCVAVNGAYSFASAGTEARIIASLADVYRERRVAIIQLIFSRPPDPLRDFADAFDFRKDKKKDGT